MFFDAITWSINRFRPREGWLSLALLIMIIYTMVAAVLDVGWVPEVGVVVTTAVFSLILAYLLAKQAKNTRLAWLLLILYGLLITTVRLASLTPTQEIIQQGFWPLREYWLQNSAIFLDRSWSWIIAVSSGNRSQETITFAIGLGMVTWFLVAFAVWTTIRQQKPILGLTFIGVALALNGFFGGTPLWYLAFFIGLVTLLSATINYSSLEQKWQHQNLDFSSEIRLEMLIYTGTISMVLLMASMSLPAISIPKMVESFLNHPWVTGAEEALDEAFGGVESRPRPRAPGSIGGRGVMPRSYLLNEVPDLTEIVVMEAKVSLENGEPAPEEFVRRVHWRGLSYEIYTGRGWTLSEEREEPLPRNQPVPLPDVLNTVNLVQEVNWVRDERLVRYTLGEPLQFDHDVVLLWRGLDDLVRVQGSQTSYETTTRISVATSDQLQETRLEDIPPVIANRYTQLPESLPERIVTIAQDVAGDIDNPYDQARALERFLRQYPYSLEIEPPPTGQDPVDYFLFDVQSGYCDYYATAMVVMARSLGIPARMAVGFLSQPPDENGVQTIRQINGHSWAELYFADYGWVEFEPTAAFPSPHSSLATYNSSSAIAERYEELYGNPEGFTPLPPRDPMKQPVDWGKIGTRIGLVVLLLFAMGGLWFWNQRRYEADDAVLAAYDRFQGQAEKLSSPILPQQTPAEFNAAFQKNLTIFENQATTRYQGRLVGSLASRLSTIFAEHQYARNPDDHSEEAQTLWNKMKRPLWALRLRKRFMK